MTGEGPDYATMARRLGALVSDKDARVKAVDIRPGDAVVLTSSRLLTVKQIERISADVAEWSSDLGFEIKPKFLLLDEGLRLDVIRPVAWQPIETAPEDGTRVLVWEPDDASGSPRMTVGHWDGEAWLDDACRYDEALRPTHWQSLPAPPTT